MYCVKEKPNGLSMNQEFCIEKISLVGTDDAYPHHLAKEVSSWK
jgi:hypothetical protein